MESTLQVGDFLLVNKLVYGAEVPFTHKRLPRLREPQRGDVIVFEYPEDPTKNFVKRLVGLPGRHGRDARRNADSERRRDAASGTSSTPSRTWTRRRRISAGSASIS